MFTKGRADHPGVLLTPLGARQERCVYFLRVAAWSRELDEVLWKCHEAARHCGAILENGVPNPENSNLTYYREILGEHYALDAAGVSADLAKWMPELPPQQREALAAGLVADFSRGFLRLLRVDRAQDEFLALLRMLFHIRAEAFGQDA